MGPGYKTVTIFGATGFIGSQVVRALAKQNFIIKLACRVPQRAYDLKPCGSVGQIVPIACNFNDPASIDSVVGGSDYVVNCIGILNQRGRNTFTRVHVDTPRMIAEACRRHKIERFVHISALGAEGGTSNYAKSKRAGEQAVRAAFPDATILRPSVVFGAEDKFFNRFAGLARMLPFLPLIGGGHTKLQPVFVGDVEDAVAAALTMPGGTKQDPRGKTYELGGPEVVDFRKIYRLIFNATGRSRFMVPLPFALAKLDGFFLGFLPDPPLTMDQVESLKTDTIVSQGALTLKDLGVEATAMETVVPSYLARFRSGGPFRALEKVTR